MNYVIKQKVEKLLNLADSNKTDGQLLQAKIILNKVIKLEPNNRIALNNIANIYKELKNFKKEIKFYLKCIFSNPSYLIAKINLGILYQEIGKLNEAEKIYKEIINIDRLNFGIYFKLSDISFGYFSEEVIKFIEDSIKKKEISAFNKASGDSKEEFKL